MIILATKASDFAQGNLFTTCTYFYRDKSKDYYEYVYGKREGIMEKYEKDCHGDPANPINGQISGLFFSATMDKIYGGPLRCPSIFGEIRVKIEPGLLLNDNTNLYFADFYCIYRSHWVQLVIAENHTPADETCRKLLIKLNKYDNPFLYISFNDRKIKVLHSMHVSVEVFYTADVNLKSYTTDNISFESIECTGHSRISGKKKNQNCLKCNINQNDLSRNSVNFL